MAPGNDQTASAPPDGRVIAYRIVKFAVLVLVCAAAVKLLVLDTVSVRTDQMAPTLADGDRAVIFKLTHAWPLSELVLPLRNSPVVFDNPTLSGSTSCLRVAALSGDSIVISRGVCYVVNKNRVARSSLPDTADILPPAFSPRDSVPPYRLPRRGASVALDSLSLRDFFFAASLIRQENPREHFSIRPVVYVDGRPADTLRTRDFLLYKGRLDSVPAKYEFDWFFWNRMQDYFVHSQEGKDVTLTFSLLRGGTRMYGYTFSKSCIFLLADDWQKGFDSRYFGPVLSSCVKGRVMGVLWSVAPPGSGGPRLRMGRLFRIIR